MINGNKRMMKLSADDSSDSAWSTAANWDSFETTNGDSANCALDRPGPTVTERPNSPTEEQSCQDVSETSSTESSMDESSGEIWGDCILFDSPVSIFNVRYITCTIVLVATHSCPFPFLKTWAESNEVDAGEVRDILQEASRTPDPGDVVALRDSLNVFEGENTPPGSDSDGDLMDTNETTWRRLARYAAEANTLSNDKNWDEMDDSDQYFTGSADTSGGCNSDGGEYPIDENDHIA
jgi:hypothetical protein